MVTVCGPASASQVTFQVPATFAVSAAASIGAAMSSSATIVTTLPFQPLIIMCSLPARGRQPDDDPISIHPADDTLCFTPATDVAGAAAVGITPRHRPAA